MPVQWTVCWLILHQKVYIYSIHHSQNDGYIKQDYTTASVKVHIENICACCIHMWNAFSSLVMQMFHCVFFISTNMNMAVIFVCACYCVFLRTLIPAALKVTTNNAISPLLLFAAFQEQCYITPDVGISENFINTWPSVWVVIQHTLN